MTEANLTEIVLAENAPDATAQKMLEVVKSKSTTPPSKKYYTELVLRDLVCEIGDNHQNSVYKKSFMSQEGDAVEYKKEKQSFHVFPSTNKLHSVSQVSKLTFKFPGHLHVHFEHRDYPPMRDKTNKVYISTPKPASAITKDQQLTQIVRCLSNYLDRNPAF
jgi:hypothetical protein